MTQKIINRSFCLTGKCGSHSQRSFERRRHNQKWCPRQCRFLATISVAGSSLLFLPASRFFPVRHTAVEITSVVFSFHLAVLVNISVQFNIHCEARRKK